MRLVARLALGLCLVGGAAALSACNTISGLGEDVNSLGKSVTKSADQTQKKM